MGLAELAPMLGLRGSITDGVDPVPIEPSWISLTVDREAAPKMREIIETKVL